MSPARRIAAGAVSLVVVAVLLAGVPAALIALAGNPLPADVPTLADLERFATRPSGPDQFIAVLAAAAWIAWASFALPVLVEIAAAVRRLPAPRMRLVSRQQKAAAALVGAIVVMFAAPVGAQAAQAEPLQFDTTAPPPAAALAVATLPAGTAQAPETETALAAYEVAEDDRLGDITARLLGDFDRYGEVAEANDIDDPDVIHPEQVIYFDPAAITDTGADDHAGGTLTMPDDAAATPDEPEPEPETEPETEPSVVPEPEPEAAAPDDAAETGASETATAAPEDTETPVSSAAADDDGLDPGDLTRIGLGAGGISLLAGVLLLALRRARRRQMATRPADMPLPQPESPAVERALTTAADLGGVDRLDAALRSLNEALVARGAGHDLPDIVGAWLVGHAVHLLLATPCADPPAPWQTSPGESSWTLPDDAELEPVDSDAPLPSLVTLGSRERTHLLVDLERLGMLTLTGPGATDLARSIACEAATNTWSDGIHMTIWGFDEPSTRALVDLTGGRIRAAVDLGDAIDRLRGRAEQTTAALAHTGAIDTFAARVTDTGADAWTPHLLVINQPGPDDLARLTELGTTLEYAGRSAAAIIVTAGDSLGRWSASTAPEGLGVDFLNLDPAAPDALTPAALAAADLTGLDGLFATAAQPTTPPPAVGEPDPEPDFDASAPDFEVVDLNDFLGAETDPESETDKPPADSPRVPAPAEPLNDTGKRLTSRPKPEHLITDATLDTDLHDWYNPYTHRPRLAILGPIEVRAAGNELSKQRRLHSELVLFIAQTGNRGATADMIDTAVWDGYEPRKAARVRRVAMTHARQWLGDTPDGDRWMPEQDHRDQRYRLHPEVLADWKLFERLTRRGRSYGPAGADDLAEALRLVTGPPMTGTEYRSPNSNRTPYAWLAGTDLAPLNLICAVADTAHALVDLALAAGDIDRARWATTQAWAADPDRTGIVTWHDALRVAAADGNEGELRSLATALLDKEEKEVLEDLDAPTYELLMRIAPDLVAVGL